MPTPVISKFSVAYTKKISNETKISLGHPTCVVQGDFRGTQTQTDGTVVPSGCKLDVSSMAGIRINIP
jgi:hypothetical protein